MENLSIDKLLMGSSKEPQVVLPDWLPEDWMDLVRRRVEALPSGGGYKDWKQKRAFDTGAFENPEEFLWMDIPPYSDYYRKEAIKQFGNSAKKHGVEPNLFTALGVAESGLGNRHFSNPTRVDLTIHEKRLKDLGYDKDYPEDLIDYSARFLSELQGKYKSPLNAAQAYSGMGRTLYGGKADKVKQLTGSTRVFGGRDFRTINFKKEKPQGKRVLAIAEALKKIPELQSLYEPSWEE